MSSESYKKWGAVTGALVGGIAASTCCVLPLVLLWAGISGAWISNLTAMSAYHSWFIGGAGLLLAISYFYIYAYRKEPCEEGELCAKPLSDKLVKSSFWAATILIGIAGLFPYVVINFYGA